MIGALNENTPECLQIQIFLIVFVELAWKGDEEAPSFKRKLRKVVSPCALFTMLYTYLWNIISDNFFV